MKFRLSALAAAALILFHVCCGAQSRILQGISAAGPRVSLRDSVAPRARAASDLGLLPDATPLTSITLRFSLTEAQDSALTRLIHDQQDPASVRYRQWLSPEAYAAEFGLPDADLARVKSYLTGQGLMVTSVARSKSFVTVAGTAAQVARAFGTSFHAVSAAGEQHFANLTEPHLPVALAGVTRGITGLNDFHLRPRVKVRQVAAPQYTSSPTNSVYLAPGDLYTIYDVNALLANAINGAGVTIAVMGQTDLSVASANAFRAASGLPVNPPAVMLYGTDPGTSAADLPEAMLDVEWSGALAPAATILYVNSTDAIAGSLTQAVDHNVAPILSISYGDCEQDLGAANIAIFNQVFRQANVQGQTVIGPGGDSGATDCDYNVTKATQGLAVDFPASSPSVTGVGGTMFHETGGTYFGATNGVNQGSALSYIPESVWNETAAFGALAGGGGGASAYFAKPSYQVGMGVPNDFSRDVPDLSLDCAVVHDGYLICTPGYCTNGYRSSTGFLSVVGGTSIAAPQFAGMLALVEQKIGARLGNANPVIYGLANSAYSNSVFHDITTGNNAMPCAAGSTGCPTGGSLGYNATAGFDLATGWGSVDAFNLVSDWLLVKPAGTTAAGSAASALSLTDSATTVTTGGTIQFTATVVSGTSGVTNMPSGLVQFLVDNVVAGGGVTIANGSAGYSLATPGLAAGAHVVSAVYSGDGVYTGAKSSVQIVVVTATAPDFSLSPSVASVATMSGTTAPGVTFTVGSLNGFSGTVAFIATTTSSVLSTTSNPTFSPGTVTLASSGSGGTVLTLMAFLPQSRTGMGRSASVAEAGLMLAGFLLLCAPRSRFRAALLLSVGLWMVAGCSSGKAGSVSAAPVNTPAGTYTVLVTATATSSTGAVTSHNATVTFTVQ